MSRGFVKEDDQEETPIITPRAALPDGVTNYVTAIGLKELKKELTSLTNTIQTLSESNERERRRALAVLEGKRKLLIERINSARLLNLVKDSDKVRFGAFVTYSISGITQAICIQIVGVDEANVANNKIAFIAPIARALIGSSIGNEISFQLGAQDKTIVIQDIAYPDDY